MDHIHLKSTSYELSLLKKNCNEQIIEGFTKMMNSLFSVNPLDIHQGDNPIYFTVNGKSYYTNKTKKIGISLLKLPKEVRRLTIQESMLCSK